MRVNGLSSSGTFLASRNIAFGVVSLNSAEDAKRYERPDSPSKYLENALILATSPPTWRQANSERSDELKTNGIDFLRCRESVIACLVGTHSGSGERGTRHHQITRANKTERQFAAFAALSM